MKKVMVTLDEETAKRARVQAAKQKTSLPRYIAEVLRYEVAYRAWREDRKPWPLKGPPQPYPKREELYDRPVFRRR